MRILKWRKWKDPLRPFVEKHEKPEGNEFRDYGFGETPDDAEDPNSIKNIGPVLCGPMGVIPLRESNLPSKLYNFWIGEANFDIDGLVSDIIKKTPGVQVFHVFDRYRFRIAIGRCFEPKAVRQEIRKRLKVEDIKLRKTLPKIEKDGALTFIKEKAKKTFPHWAIIRGNTGKYEVVSGVSREEVEEKLGDKERFGTSW